MNKVKKNVVVVGFSENERHCLGIPYDNPIRYVNSLSEAIKYQGYLLVIDNKDDINYIDLDKKYRKSFNKYERIWLYNESYNCYLKKDKWSRIEKVGGNIFNDGFEVGIEWEEYKLNKENEIDNSKSFNYNKRIQVDKLYNYLKDYKTITTEKISKDLNINPRNIQRYMNDLNNIYHNVGYDCSKNEWYII